MFYFVFEFAFLHSDLEFLFWGRYPSFTIWYSSVHGDWGQSLSKATLGCREGLLPTRYFILFHCFYLGFLSYSLVFSFYLVFQSCMCTCCGLCKPTCTLRVQCTYLQQ
jgi:hypothetical protein